LKSYTAYTKIHRPYFNLSEFIGFPILPIAAIAFISFGILFFFGLKAMLMANVGIAVVLTFIYTGLKNASPNGSQISTSIGISSVITLLPSFLVILGVILLTNVGVYIVATFLKTGVFHAIYFYVWLFVLCGLPAIYIAAKELKYQFYLYYQAYYFTPLPLRVVHDYELLSCKIKIAFLNTKGKFISEISVGSHEKVELVGKLSNIPVSERNDCLYDPVFNDTVYIPKQTDRIRISWYSVIEDTQYDGEIDFPFDKLNYVPNKYPLDVPEFLRGKKTDPVMLALMQDGKIQLYNKHQDLTERVSVKSIEVSEEQKQKQFRTLASIYTVKSIPTLINTIKESKAIQRRAGMADYLCSWQITGSGLEGHNIEIKDVRHNYRTSAPLELNSFESRRLPIFFEIDYHKISWLYIHIDAEKLYRLLQENLDGVSQLTFDFTIDLETGKAELLIKNNEKVLPFTAWEKKLDAYRWEEAKGLVLENKDFTIKNNFLKEIYELIVAQKYVEAEALCETALEQYPYFPMIYFYKARLLWYKQGFDASYEKQSYFLERTKTDPYALAQIYNHYGCLYDEQDRHIESLECFEKAYAIYPTMVLYLSNIAEVHYKLKNANKAVHYAEECLAKGFTSDMVVEIINNKGVIMDKAVDNSIAGLQMELSNLASQYRSAQENSELHHKVLKEYYSTFEKIVELNGEILALDPDAELPDSFMPKAYVDYWLNSGDAK